MALDSFTFAIALPPAPGSLPLFEELSGQMSRYLGLEEVAARTAAGLLNRLVADRLNAGGPVEVRFTRPDGTAPVSVEVSGPALPGDADLTAVDGADVLTQTDGQRSRLRLQWTAVD
jgi:hypothetical protein